MGGAPPLPLDFAPQGSKNGHFLAFFGGPPGALFGPKKGPHGPPRIPVGGVAKCPPRGPFDPPEGLVLDDPEPLGVLGVQPPQRPLALRARWGSGCWGGSLRQDKTL